MIQRHYKLLKRMLCCLFLSFSFCMASPVTYETVKDTDNTTVIRYSNQEHGYYVVACYYKLYFEIKVEVYFYSGLPSEGTLASIENEQFFYLTKYFQELPYRPLISQRKANVGRKMYSFTILYKGRVVDNN